MVDSCFVNNTSGYEGGAITADSTTDVQISGSWFGVNWADYNGGAILYAGRSPGPGLDITTSTFDGNNAGYSGGAIEVGLGGWGDQTGALNDCTVSGNTADSGAAFSLNNRGWRPAGTAG